MVEFKQHRTYGTIYEAKTFNIYFTFNDTINEMEVEFNFMDYGDKYFIVGHEVKNLNEFADSINELMTNDYIKSFIYDTCIDIIENSDDDEKVELAQITLEELCLQ